MKWKCFESFQLQRGVSVKGWIEAYSPVLGSTSTQPHIQCSLGNMNVKALIDTNSMKSFFSQQVFAELQPQPKLHPFTSNCVGITFQPLHILGTAQVKLSFPCNGFHSYPDDFQVSSNLLKPLHCILGWDFLNSNGLQLVCKKANGKYFLEGTHGSTPLTPYDDKLYTFHP